MKLVRPLGWVFLGALLGALAARATEPAHAQTEPLQRLVIVDDQDRSVQPDIMGRRRASPSLMGTQRFAFIKDTQSGGCWLKLETPTQTLVALAPAPESACK